MNNMFDKIYFFIYNGITFIFEQICNNIQKKNVKKYVEF